MGNTSAGSPRAARILIADDDPISHQIYHTLLRNRSHETAHARCGEEATSLLRRDDFDVILSDIYMPGNNSLEFVKRAGREFPLVSVILVTGSPDINTAIRALRLGVVDYLSKPLVLEQFIARVHVAIDRTRRRRRVEGALRTLTGELIENPAIEAQPPSSPDGCPLLGKLSRRERDVALAFLRSFSIVTVGNQLGISEHTVRNHFRSIYRKLEIHSRAEFITYARSVLGENLPGSTLLPVSA